MTKEAIQQVLALHQWESENLPLFKKSIGQAVVLRVLDAFISDQPLSVKELSLSLPYSSSGIRLQLRMLEDAGWIEFAPSLSDQRVKVIQPSPTLRRCLENYALQCNAIRIKNLLNQAPGSY